MCEFKIAPMETPLNKPNKSPFLMAPTKTPKTKTTHRRASLAFLTTISQSNGTRQEPRRGFCHGVDVKRLAPLHAGIVVLLAVLASTADSFSLLSQLRAHFLQNVEKEGGRESKERCQISCCTTTCHLCMHDVHYPTAGLESTRKRVHAG